MAADAAAADPSRLAPFNPTCDEAIDAALDMARVGADDVVLDIGCGDGRFLFAAARRGATAVGIERDPVLAARGIARVAEAEAEAGGPCGVRVIHGDALEPRDDVPPPTVVFVYLVPAGLAKVLPVLTATLQRGGRVVSNIFGVPGWTPTQRRTARGLPVLLYEGADVCVDAAASSPADVAPPPT